MIRRLLILEPEGKVTVRNFPRTRWFAIPLLVLAVWFVGCSRDPESTKRRLLAVGNRYYAQGKYREASIIYRRAIQYDRRFGEAYHRLGLTYLKLNRPQDAVAAFRRAVELQPANVDAYGQLADLYLAAYLADPETRKPLLSELQGLLAQLDQHVPNSAEGHRVRGMVALAQRDYEQAIKELQAAVDKRPDDGRAQVALAEALAAAGRWDEAQQRARAWIKQHPHEPEMYDFLYLNYVLRRQMDQAEAVLREKSANNPKELLYQMQLVRHFWATGQQPQARAHIEALLSRHNDYPEVFEQVANFWTRLRQFDEALRVLDQATKAQPKQARRYQRNKAEVLGLAGRREEALQLVERLLKEDSKDGLVLALRGALRLQQAKPEELDSAIADLEAGVRAVPDNPVIRYNLAEGYRMRRRWDDAIREYQEALRVAPGYVAARHGMARAYLGKQDYGRALAIAEELLRANPDDLLAAAIQVQALLGSNEIDRAAKVLEQFVQRHPEANDLVYGLALVRMREKRFDEAEKLFRRLTEGPQADPRAVLGLAEVQAVQGKMDQALALLQQRIKQEPANVGYRLAYAQGLAQAGKLDDAIREYEAIAASDPKNAVARRQLGVLHARKGALDRAEQWLRQAEQLAPKDTETLLALGMVAQQRRDLAKAKSYYEKVLAIDPDHVIAANNLAYLLAEGSEQLDRALTLAQRARSQAPQDPRIADTLGWVYVKRGLYDEALNILEPLVRQHPQVAAWRYHLAVALARKGERDRARQELRRALQSKPDPEERGPIEKLLKELGP